MGGGDKIGMKKLFSGIQPTGIIHLGNYLGAIKQWVELQKKYEAFFCIVDLHAITIPKEPKELQKDILKMANVYLALGINPAKSTIFIQSDVSAHSEGAWIFGTLTHFGELKRMTQFKEKSENQENYSLGLFAYPTLMASDILLYDINVVPVGEDQVQHVELTRDLAKRFNNRFGKIFVVPEIILPKFGARIMGLDDPTKKMSKSASSPLNYIALTDKPEIAKQKIMKAATDSGNEIKYNPESKPGISNLLTIYSLLTNKEIPDLEKKYKGKGYGEFKKDLAEIVVKFLIPFQKKLTQLEKNSPYAKKILKAGALKANTIASAKILEVKKKMGLGL